MLRGNRSIYNSLLFPEETLSATLAAPPERKGRSEELINRRNELLICRYYYYVKMKGRQYEPALSALETELFISQRTIIDTVQRNAELLKQLFTTRPEISYFRTKYPWLTW